VPDFAFPGPGVKVDQVSEGSPASAAGIQAGDILVRIEDSEVTDLRSYSEILKTLEPGQEVAAVVSRDGEEVIVRVTVEAR
jgi:S1-C subfamily serine protease